MRIKYGLFVGIILGIVVVIGLILSQQKGEEGFLVLEGPGCEKTSEGGICEAVREDTRIQLRDCNDGETICDMSWFQLGSANRTEQYVLLYAEGIQMQTIYSVDRATLDVIEIGRHFYTEVAEGCESQQDIYEEECFPYPLTEEQRRDVWETNQAYIEAEEQYR